jgi:hypothetical protein
MSTTAIAMRKLMSMAFLFLWLRDLILYRRCW